VVSGITHAYLLGGRSSWALLSHNRADLGSRHRGLARQGLISERSLGIETAERSRRGRVSSASARAVSGVYRECAQILAFEQLIGREYEAGGETDAKKQ
jgi:hypothetical protein